MSGICNLPSTHLAFEQRFSTEIACIEYLRRQRWPDGFHCPRCAGRRAWGLRSRALDQCASCGHQVSLTAAMVFHGPRKPLVLWFRVIGQFLVSKSGCSAVDVSRQHGLKYETAWTWLHKLRSCMSQFGREPLDGSVEVDETYLGGEDDDAHKGRCLTGHKTPVAAAVECGGERSAASAQGACHPIHLQSRLAVRAPLNRRLSCDVWLLFRACSMRVHAPTTYAALAGRPPLSVVAA